MAKPKADLPDRAALLSLVDGEGRLALRVTPGARVESLTVEDGHIQAKVRAKPQDGAANEAVIALLAAALGCAPTRITMLRGATSRMKVVQVAMD